MRLAMSAVGTKRTCRVALHMSAFDPKRTFTHVSLQSRHATFKEIDAFVKGKALHL